MKKIILILLMTFMTMFAETISFKEEKFVESLELYTYRDGNVTYAQDKTTVAYKDGRTIVKNENNVTVYDDDEVLTVISLVERPEVGLHFSLTKALFKKDFDLLKENFEMKQVKKGLFEFTPKGDVANLIKKLKLYLDKEDNVEALKLEFNNGDKITIEAK